MTEPHQSQCPYVGNIHYFRLSFGNRLIQIFVPMQMEALALNCLAFASLYQIQNYFMQDFYIYIL